MAYLANRDKKTYDVVVVGAGAAGIACVKELVDRGYRNIACLEATDKAGGRVRFNSKFGDVGGMSLHLPNKFLKVQNLHSEFWGASDLVKFANKNNFSFYRENNRPKFRLYHNGQKIKEGIVNHANSLIMNAIKSAIDKIKKKELPAEISLREALSDLLEDDICRSLITTVYSTTDTGLDVEDISFVDYTNTMPSNPGLFPIDGMGTLLSAYARPIRQYISFNKEVLAVRNDAGLITVSGLDTKTGTSFGMNAKTLVLTVSIGVLQSWMKEEKITLAKEKILAIDNIKMGRLNKNILLMKEKFFTENNIRTFTHINIRSNRLDQDANFLAVNLHGKYFMINFVGGKKSLRYEKKGTAFARKDSLKILASVFGPDVYEFFIDSYLSQWNTNKFFHGAYTASTKENLNARLELSEPLDKNIYYAGEAVRYSVDEISYHTHISGALHSGFMTANAVIRNLEF